MKKLISILLCVLLGLATMIGATGCDVVGGGNVMHTATATNLNGRLDKEKADLIVTFQRGGRGVLHWVDLKNKFQKETGKTVYLEGTEDASDKAGAQWLNGVNCSDVYAVNTNPLSYIALGKIEKLNDIYNTKVSGEKTVHDMLKNDYKEFGYVKSDNIDGYYLLPQLATSGGLYYKQKILDKAYDDAVLNGHATVNWKERAPETYAELLELVEDINKMDVNTDSNPNNNIAPFIWSTEIPNYWSYLVETWFVQMIGIEKYELYEESDNLQYFNPESADRFEIGNATSGKKQVNYAEAKQMALELLEGLIVENKSHINVNSDHVTKGFQEMQALFANDKAAMIPNGTWLETELSNKVSATKLADMRYMSVPFAPYAKTYESGEKAGEYKFINNTLSTFSGVLIPTGAKHKDLAKDFILFMCREENLKNTSYAVRTVSAYNIEVNMDSFSQAAKDAFAVVERADSEGGNFFYIPKKSQLAYNGKAMMWHYNAFGNMLTGQSRKSAAECITLEWERAQANFAS